MGHRLHERIGEHLRKVLQINGILAIYDRACGGNQSIPLFFENQAHNATECTNVDIMFLKNNQIKVIIEIEESNIKPSHIAGKYFIATLATCYIHNPNGKNADFSDNAAFIQIVDISKLKQDLTSKIEQFKKLEKKIVNALPIGNKRIGSYALLPIEGVSDENKISSFIDIVKYFLDI